MTPHTSGRRTGRLLAAAVLAAGAACLVPSTASAAVTPSFANGVLTLNGDLANSLIEVTCVNGTTVVNGSLQAAVPCGSVTSIEIDAGGGNDRIELGAATAAGGFTALTTTDIDGQDGTDIVRGAPITDAVRASGDDVDTRGGDDRVIAVVSKVSTGDGNDAVKADLINTVDSGDGDDLIEAAGLMAGGAGIADAGPGNDRIVAGGITSARGGDGDDRLEVENASIDGGAGNDDIVPRGAPEVRGGDGNDRIDVTAGVGALDAGAGDDTVIGVLDGAAGGDGRDLQLLDFAALPGAELNIDVTDTGIGATAPSAPGASFGSSGFEAVDLRLPAGDQRVDASAFTGDLRVDAGLGDDDLRGGSGTDELIGGPGNDAIDAGDGIDRVDGGQGADAVRTRDGARDVVDCGSSVDSLFGDREDALTDCETIDLPSAPAPAAAPPADAADRTPPAVKVGRATLKGSRLRLTVACPRTETRCVGRAGLRASGRRGRKAASVTVGRVTFDIAGGSTRTVRRTLSRAQRTKLATLRRPRLALALDVRDAAGNRTTRRTTVAVKRAG